MAVRDTNHYSHKGRVQSTIIGREPTAKSTHIVGLIEMGLVRKLTLDIEGVMEVNYMITALGVQVYRAYSGNDRYKKNSENK